MIVPATLKSPLKIPLPVTTKKSFTVNDVCTSNPLFGEIIVCTEPDFILSISPIEDAGIFVIPLPSPTKVLATTEDAEIDDDTNNEPVIFVFP